MNRVLFVLGLVVLVVPLFEVSRRFGLFEQGDVFFAAFGSAIAVCLLAGLGALILAKRQQAKNANMKIDK